MCVAVWLILLYKAENTIIFRQSGLGDVLFEVVLKNALFSSHPGYKLHISSKVENIKGAGKINKIYNTLFPLISIK